MSSVGNTASIPSAKGNGDKLVECFGFVRYARKSNGSSLTQLPSVTVSFFLSVANNGLFVDSTNPFAYG